MFSKSTLGFWTSCLLFAASGESSQSISSGYGWEKIESISTTSPDTGQLLIRGARVYVSDGEMLYWSENKGDSWSSTSIPALPFEVSLDGSQFISGSSYKNLNEQNGWVEEVCIPANWGKKKTCSFMGNDTLWIPSIYERVGIKTLDSSGNWISPEEPWSDIQSQDNLTFGNIRTINPRENFVVATGHYQFFISRRDSIFFHDFGYEMGYEMQSLSFRDCDMLNDTSVVCVTRDIQTDNRQKFSVLKFGVDLDSGKTEYYQNVFSHPFKDSLIQLKRLLVQAENSNTTSNSKVFLASARHLFTSDENWNWQRISLPDESTLIHDLAVHPDGTIFLHTEDGLYKSSTNASSPVLSADPGIEPQQKIRPLIPGFAVGKGSLPGKGFSVDGRMNKLK